MAVELNIPQQKSGLVDALQATFKGWHGWAVPLFLAILLYVISHYNFLLFHTLAELFAITVAVILCVVAWHTYGFSRNHFLMYLGTGYFWIAILDLFHTFTFKGMNILHGISPNESIQFWIITRYQESFLLLSAPYFFTRRVNRMGMFLLFAAGTVLTLYLTFNGYLPDAYIDGTGLTQFKVISEYIIIALLVAAIVLLNRNKTLMDRRIFVLMVISILFTALAEYTFTLYSDVQSLPMYIGHILKLFSYWLIFIAVVQTTLTEPYNIMARGSSTYDAIPAPTVVVDHHGIIRQVNKAVRKQSGLAANRILDRHCHEVLHPSDIRKEDCVICNHIASRSSIENFEMYFPDRKCWREFSLSPYETLGDIKGMVHVYEDISDRKKAEQELIYQANYDVLTKFPNRILATDRLKMLLKNVSRSQAKIIVMFIDIDNFKNVNDTLGHDFGDRLIIEVANHIGNCVRDSDTVARWGGDEFLVVLPDMESIEKAETVANKILHIAANPLLIDDKEINVSVSIGITGAPDDGEDSETLLKHADAAMYEAKNYGKNTFHFFTSDMNIRAEQHMLLEAELRNAIKRNELSLYYQPQIDLITRKVVGCEALLRWNNKKQGIVPPDRFIPLAEESNLIVSIGEWVLQQACRDIKGWLAKGIVDEDFTVSVNVSSKQVQHGELSDTFTAITSQYELSASNIVLELTENLLLDEREEIIATLNFLDQTGFRLSLDDFGTGFSSLSYLKKYPFSEIKIDRGFINDIATDPNDAALCQAIIAMAKSLDMKVVGEGVEDEKQLEFLSRHQANIVQGYYFCEPLDEQAFVSSQQSLR